MSNLLWKRYMHCSTSLPPSCSLRVSLNVHPDIVAHSGYILVIENSKVFNLSLAGHALISASHAQFADWPLRAGYLFMMQWCQPIHYVAQFKSSHVGSNSRVPTSGVGKDGPHQFLAVRLWTCMKFGRKQGKFPIVRLQHKRNKSHDAHASAMTWHKRSEEVYRVLGFFLIYMASMITT